MLPRPAPGFIPVSLRKMTKGEGAMASDILGYKGKRVVVMGCFSGTGEACARALVDLGAEVHGADIKPSPVNLASFTEVDLQNPYPIAAGIAALVGRIDAVFTVSGLHIGISHVSPPFTNSPLLCLLLLFHLFFSFSFFFL